jgi:hypothetical protein
MLCFVPEAAMKWWELVVLLSISDDRRTYDGNKMILPQLH